MKKQLKTEKKKKAEKTYTADERANIEELKHRKECQYENKE